MPEVEVIQDFDLPVDATFFLVFGQESFLRFHESESHTDISVGDWGAGDGNNIRRDCGFNLPPNNLIMMPAISVRCLEVAHKDKNGIWIISGSSKSEGNEFAKATHCSATMTLAPHKGGTRVVCAVVYSFVLSSIPWVLRKTVELVMKKDMRSGYEKMLEAALKLARAGFVAPVPHAVQAYLRQCNESANRSFTSSQGSFSGASVSRQTDQFYTPMATPTHSMSADPATTPYAEDLLPVVVPPIDAWCPDVEIPRDSTVVHMPTEMGDASSEFGHMPLREFDVVAARQPHDSPQQRVPLTASNLMHAAAERIPRRYASARYRTRIILLVLALSVSWCLGHLSAMPPPPTHAIAASFPPRTD
eukprot:Rhum_TRINITY_DN24866_c0_g1::Rhum_TRINITY_DN24866_c0_g1_i1::g.180185::m.180185